MRSLNPKVNRIVALSELKEALKDAERIAKKEKEREEEKKQARLAEIIRLKKRRLNPKKKRGIEP